MNANELDIKENAYAHRKRLSWIESRLGPQDKVLEVGCGTGVMLTLPLLSRGVEIHGVDLDRESVEYGREIFAQQGFSPDRIQNIDLAQVDGPFDVIILSEVLEHCSDTEIKGLLDLVRTKLKRDGYFLVTVPNGFGCFELESFLYFKTILGRLLEVSRFDRYWLKFKLWLGAPMPAMTPSTLSTSPHIQHFTLRKIRTLLGANMFRVEDVQGSSMFSGPFSHLLFSGFSFPMYLNNLLADWLPSLASGFYVVCTNECGEALS